MLGFILQRLRDFKSKLTGKVAERRSNEENVAGEGPKEEECRSLIYELSKNLKTFGCSLEVLSEERAQRVARLFSRSRCVLRSIDRGGGRGDRRGEGNLSRVPESTRERSRFSLIVADRLQARMARKSIAEINISSRAFRAPRYLYPRATSCERSWPR